MSELEKRIEEFKKLPYDKKYEKVLAMLEILKEWDEVFADFYNLLTALKTDTSEELLVNIYSMLTSAIIELEKEDSQKELEKLDRLRNKMKKLKEIEEQQRQEDDPEKLLENI